MEMISHYYSGRIFAMYHKGTEYSRKYPHEFCRRDPTAFRHAGRVHGVRSDDAVRSMGAPR